MNMLKIVLRIEDLFILKMTLRHVPKLYNTVTCAREKIELPLPSNGEPLDCLRIDTASKRTVYVYMYNM